MTPQLLKEKDGPIISRELMICESNICVYKYVLRVVNNNASM